MEFHFVYEGECVIEAETYEGAVKELADYLRGVYTFKRIQETCGNLAKADCKKIIFESITPQDLANFLRIEHPNKLWTVDGEIDLSSKLDFPCTTEDLVMELCKRNIILHYTDCRSIKTDPVYLLLHWDYQLPTDSWIIIEDVCALD